MNVSLNEVEATAKKAARGAGYPWGLAEEAGKATRWLCARNIDGCAALAALLSRIDREGASGGPPDANSEVWISVGATLCPLATGAALSDHADEITGRGLRLEEVAVPILLAPFAALVAQQIKQTVRIATESAEVSTDGVEISQRGNLPDPAKSLSVKIGGTLGEYNPPCSRGHPEPQAWRQLNEFAHRTYAPATEESRRLGAGAGLSDND